MDELKSFNLPISIPLSTGFFYQKVFSLATILIKSTDKGLQFSPVIYKQKNTTSKITEIILHLETGRTTVVKKQKAYRSSILGHHLL